MIATKVLTALNDKINPIVIPRDHIVKAGLQYGAGGLGTIELQGTLNDVDYVTIGLTPAGGGAIVTSLAAAGAASADVSQYSRVQVNKTVAGAGGVTASLSLASSSHD